MIKTEELTALFSQTRKRSENLCQPLAPEDYAVQPVSFVSPPKWHLGHSSWFFEEFVLKPHKKDYQEFHPDFSFIFNSYYEAVGNRVQRAERGNLTRPGINQIYDYRAYVTRQMESFLDGDTTHEILKVTEIGIHHEKQHQELLLTDIKYILGHNPLLPAYRTDFNEDHPAGPTQDWIAIEEGIYNIGHDSDGFCYDNELGRHRVYLNSFEISSRLEKNKDFIDFIDSGGYRDHRLWHAEGLDWVRQNAITAPLYWHRKDDGWHHYSLGGSRKVDPQATLTHISYYEAYAYAQWKGQRLPTEFEWEVAQSRFRWGQRWEWTESAYLPYPGFKIAPGALGEYNGKFMVNQKVLRGGSIATPLNHTRSTYRNFFHPHLRWQFTGLRLAR
jgi:ergothioneine biosynthesis protein EgtB